ncbi:hypothetical protein JCM8547_001552 [Rhodosporidiobolus lusitaniae]
MSSSSSAALRTTGALILLQVSSRLFSFALNQFLLRSVDPQAFGTATIRFDTLIGTVLFLLREGVRGAVVRTCSPSNTTTTSSTPLSRTLYLPTLLSPLALLAFLLYSSYLSPPASLLPPFYNPTLALYLLATLLELSFEPLYLRTLQDWETLTTGRVRVEGVATLVKAFATLGVVKLGVRRKEDGLLAFGVGQVAYSATIWVGLWWIVRKHRATSSSAVEKEEKPALASRGFLNLPSPLFHPPLLSLSWALTKQSLVKQLLTEGDKLAVGKFGSGEDMAGYAVALNYGSLIARIVFLPLEESSRLYFSSLSHSSHSSSSSTTRVPLSHLLSVSSYLRLLLLLHTHLTLLFLLLAPSYTTPLLTLLLGPTWSSTAGPTLRAYCLSLPFLGFNGLTEAFFQSVASPSWIARGSAWMAACAVGFAGAVALFCGGLGMGARGLVSANCVNMAMRVGFSVRFMRAFFRDQLEGRNGKEEKGQEEKVKEQLRFSSWTPRPATVLAFALGGWMVRASEGRWAGRVAELAKEAGKGGRWESLRATAEHLGVGACVGVGCLAVVFLTRRHEIRGLVSSLKGSTPGGGDKKED